MCVCVCEHDQHFSLLTFSFSIINIIVFNIFQTNQTMAGACRGTAGRVHRRTVLCVWAVRKQQLYSMSFFFTAPLSPTIFFPAENNLYTSGGMLYIVTYSAVYRFYLCVITPWPGRYSDQLKTRFKLTQTEVSLIG